MANEALHKGRLNRRAMLLGGTSVIAATALAPVASAQAVVQGQTPPQTPAGGKPNIVVIWGDDIGITNLSCYSMGMMGYRTPNIDRIAREGMTVHRLLRRAVLHGGRSSFITGQSVFRTGLSRSVSRCQDRLRAADPTIAEMLKPLGYATGQFGKNIWAIATNSCPPCMASTNSTAISIT